MFDTNVTTFFKDFVYFIKQPFLWFFIENIIERLYAKIFEKKILKKFKTWHISLSFRCLFNEVTP